ncbi:VWA domain-containing protein [Kitasatospora purpeofusca]|uniref:VWA domain-containing protein n=1 Tax=Kitasatospora purpeofusca TaxID=67352 RepID=UPI003688916C
MADQIRHLVLIVDQSGSMEDLRTDMEGGVATFLAEQQEVSGTTLVTLVLFNSDVETDYELRPLAEVPRLRLRPMGRTGLLDAIGSTIRRIERRAATGPAAEQPAETVYVIVTDGKENASQEFSNDVVRYLIGEQEQRGATFVYMAANQDAFAVARGLGINPGTVLPYDTAATEASMTSLGRAVARGSRTGDYAFTEAEREQATRPV